MVEAPIRRGYGVVGPDGRHAGRATATALLVAATTAVAVGWRAPLPVVLGAIVCAGVGRVRVGLLVALLGLVAVGRADSAWAGLTPDHLGHFGGWAHVVDEPQRSAGAARVILEIDGERFEVWVRGRAAQQRVGRWRAGDQVLVAGERTALDDDRRDRVAWQHVVGDFAPDWLSDSRAGAPLAVASNRVRALVQRGASVLPADQAALARGLVIGDDRDQPPDMVQRFRDSGLAHLTAVSGQNVALLLAAAGPLLSRARPFARWALTLAIIGWFVVLTRAEPSVLRAGTMAALSATAFALGREREAVRSLAVAVTVLLLADPLLARSVGFWLSVGATAGVTGIGPALARRLHRLGPLAMPVAVTLGAQLGVAVPSLLVFGRLSLIGTLANLVAVPVAGLVMLFGLPACLLAGAVPVIAPVVVAPVAIGVRWVDAVATVAAAAEPPAPWSWLGWIVLALAVLSVATLRRRDTPVR
ncbi:MAG: ComEC/Rec2 family competence protein [Ilumatobacteraceae bacterium]